MSQRFDGARMLRTSRRYADRPQRTRRPVRAMTAAAGLAVAAIAVVLFLPSHELSSPDSARQPSRAVTAAADNAEGALTRSLAAPAAEIRSVRSETRRVGKAGVSKCRSRWSRHIIK